MAKIDITKTELVWPGKYNEDGTLKEVPRVSLPFQVIETVNESRASREAKKLPQQATLFDVYEGKGIEPGKKSIAITVTLQPREKTMTDAEIEAVAAKIVAEVGKRTGGVLRA